MGPFILGPLRGYRASPGTVGEEENILEIEAVKLLSVLDLLPMDSSIEISDYLPVRLAVRGSSEMCKHLWPCTQQTKCMQLFPEIVQLVGMPHAFNL